MLSPKLGRETKIQKKTRERVCVLTNSPKRRIMGLMAPVDQEKKKKKVENKKEKRGEEKRKSCVSS